MCAVREIVAKQDGLRGEHALFVSSIPFGWLSIIVLTMSILACAALLERVASVQAEGAKLRSDNETLQTCTPHKPPSRHISLSANIDSFLYFGRHRQPHPHQVRPQPPTSLSPRAE